MDHFTRPVILLGLLALTVGGETITCLFSKECVLPCSSNYFEIIHWYHNEENVHSFYKGADQLEHQDPAYKGRTALFTDQISEGNISLILSGVKIQDGGKYKCYTAISSDNKEAFVTVNVRAPIQSVDIKMTDNNIICKTNKVYPKPTISWNINGVPKENVQNDNQGLISLTSTLPVQPVQNNTTYTCFFTSEDRTHIFKASLAQDKTEIDSGEDIAIPCPDSQGETGHFSLTLMLDGSSVVLSFDSQTSLPINMQWKDTDVKVTQEGRITLHNLDSAKHAGIYTCERTSAHSRQIMQTFVQIKPGSNTTVIGGVVAAVVVIICVTAAVICILRKQKKTHTETTPDESTNKLSAPSPSHE